MKPLTRKTPAYHVSAAYSLGCFAWIQFPDNKPGETAKIAQKLGLPKPTWETRVKFLSPSFGLAQANQQRMNQQI